MATRAERIRIEKLDGYRQSLQSQTYFCQPKIDAILAYLHDEYPKRTIIPAGFQPNLLLALQAINEFATLNKIRFEDSLMVLHHYATNPPKEGLKEGGV